MDRPQSPNPAEAYEQFFVPAMFAPWTPMLLKHAAPRPGERVLDVACGTGIVARKVAPIVGAEGTVVALDLSSVMLDVARGLPVPAGARIEWREGNAQALPLPDDAFDLVLCQHGLQFFSDRRAAVREMQRVLARAGRVVLSVWQGVERHPLYETLAEVTARHLGTSIGAVSPQFSLGDAAELRTLLNAAGFRRVEIATESLAVCFPSTERFMSLTVLGAATVVPAFAQLEARARSRLVEAVTRESDATLRRYVDGETVAFPTFANIGMAYT